jgi:hypothetical protein
MITTPREAEVMATPSHGFKRLVLALQPGAASVDLRFAAEMARLLDLDLIAVMLDDLGLAEAARLPFTREFRGPAFGWQRINPDQLAYDVQAATGNLRRSFESAARELEANAQFEVMKGPLAETIRAVSRAGDILLLAEPASPAERSSVQFNWLTEAVLGSPAAVLLVPARLARRRGPVVVIEATRDDRSIQVAAEIAASCGEELVIIDADHPEPPPRGPRACRRRALTRRTPIGAGRRLRRSHATPSRIREFAGAAHRHDARGIPR